MPYPTDWSKATRAADVVVLTEPPQIGSPFSFSILVRGSWSRRLSNAELRRLTADRDSHDDWRELNSNATLQALSQ